MNSVETYKSVIRTLKAGGYETSVSLTALQNGLMQHFKFHQASAMKFHIKNMEDLNLIRMTQLGLWEIVE